MFVFYTITSLLCKVSKLLLLLLYLLFWSIFCWICRFEKATSVAAGSFYIFLCVICGATATFCKELGITVFGVAVNYSILSVWQSSKSIKYDIIKLQQCNQFHFAYFFVF